MPDLLSQVDAKMSEFSEAVKQELPKWEGPMHQSVQMEYPTDHPTEHPYQVHG
jgi:hypothetical protein